MSRNDRLLSVMLVAFGIILCLVYPVAIVWPSGWTWHEGPAASNDYFIMIVGVYATLGVFLMRAARNPAANTSLIWFTVWSSVVHAAIMTVQAIRSPMQHGHLYGDIPALLVVAAVLGVLQAKAGRTPAGHDASQNESGA